MRRDTLELTLLDPVALTRDPTSAGRPECLDYIPGASLLGAFASRGFETGASHGLSGFDMFFSGAVRFGDALPVSRDDGTVGYPVPLSLHFEKGDDSAELKCLNKAHAIAGKSIERQESGEAYEKQFRDAALTLSRLALKPKKGSALKTAIDAEKGRARDSQLFAIEALDAGQVFRATIAADDPAALDVLREVVVHESIIRIGRSRRQEYGRVQVHWAEDAETVPVRDASNVVTLWLLSDYCPDPATGLEDGLGFVNAKLDKGSSFLRMRCYQTWNAHWQARGLERQVIERGSVLVLNDATASLQNEITRGLFQECGLGRIAVNPVLLSEQWPHVHTKRDVLVRADTREGSAATPAYEFARRRAASQSRTAHESHADALREIRTLSSSLAQFNGSDFREAGPGPSQWSRVREVFETAKPGDKTPDMIVRALGTRKQKTVWDEEFNADGGNFRQWLTAKADVLDCPSIAVLAHQAARQAQDIRDGRIDAEAADA